LAALAVLAVLNLAGVRRVIWYVLVGLVLWVFVLKSGVHATLAGVALALAIPLRAKPGEASPLARIEHELAPWVGFGVLPGIGFTMSLFIGTLAFGESDREAPMRLGVLAGSALSAIVGAAVLGLAKRR